LKQGKELHVKWGKNRQSVDWLLLKFVWQSILFSTLMFMPVILARRRGIKDISVESETVCLWLVDHSYDHAKTLCCL